MRTVIHFLGFIFLRDAVKPWFPFLRDTRLLLEWALTSSVLILIVLAVRWLFRNKLSARLRYALWGVVLIRLLVPFQVELPTSTSGALPVLASNLAPEPPASWEEQDVPVFPGEEVPIEEAHPYYQSFTPGYLGPGPWSDGCVSLSEDGSTVTYYADIFTRNEVIQSVWWVGVLIVSAVLLISNLRFDFRLEERRKRFEPGDSPIPVYTAEGLASPCLFGVIRPAVYVTPGAAEDPRVLRHILAHELTHYAHKDHIWSLLRCFSLALHWYNPLVWLAVALSKGDGELACDEGAIARLGEAERIPYGRTLVDMVAARSLRPADLLSCSTAMTGGKKSITQRVSALVQKPETVRTALFAAIALVALAVVFVFAGRGTAEQGMLADYLDRTTAISYSPPTYSSTFYPNPITKENLLDRAKEALRSAAPLGPDDPEPDRDTLMHASIVTLTLEDGTEVYYTLLPQNGCTYVLEGAVNWYEDTQQDPWYSEAFRSEEDIISTLESLARLSTRKDEPGSLELEQFLADVKRAGSIWVDPPSNLSYPELITDSDLVAIAKGRLSTFVLPEEGDALPTPEELTSVSRLVLSDGGKEAVYILAMWNGYTWLIPGDANLEEGLEYGEIFRSAEEGDIAARVSYSAVLQTGRVPTNSSGLHSISREALSEYTPEFLQELGVTQLQGLPGGMENMRLHSGYISRDQDIDRVRLKYWGDEEHAGLWVLDMETPAKYANPSVIDHTTVLADQPNAVFNAGLGANLSPGQPQYQTMDPDSFALLLRPEDVVSVTAGNYEPGHAIGLDALDLSAMQEQLTWALRHQFFVEYDEEKYGQYVINIEVTGTDYTGYNGVPLAMEEDKRLTISAGAEQDVVCLYHRTFAESREGQYVFVRSPELYRTIRNIFD